MYHTGLMFGLLCGLLAGFLVLAVLFKKKILSMEFDERQELARGKAFQYSFLTLMICLFLYAASEMALGRWCDAFAGVMICIALSITVFAVTCILKDAYLSLREKPRTIMTMFALLSALNLGIGGTYLFHGGLVEDGILTFRVTNLIAGLMCLAVLIVYIVNFLLRDRGEGE